MLPPCCSICVTTPNGDETFALAKTPVSVGRNPQADVPIAHASVSRQHAQFEFAEGRWQVRHLTSTNGLQVNGAEVLPGQRRPLANGDVLRLSKHVSVRVSLPADPAATLTDSQTQPAGRPAAGCGLWLDEPSGQIYLNQRLQGHLASPEQRQLLSLFCRRPNEAIPYADLLRAAYPAARLTHKQADIGFVQTLVKRLRESLRLIDPAHDYILNVRGAGYKFVQRGQ